MNGRASAEGLWLSSTVEGATGEPFRIIARAVGRGRSGALPPCGRVEAGDRFVRLARAGVAEEYSLSVDGVQQDFLIERRPEGTGNLCIGGNFTTVGDVAANYVAQWNGSSWSALGSGMNSVVETLAVSGASGQTLVIQASTDLLNWLPLQTNVLGSR